MGDGRWGKRSGKEGQLVELVGDQNPDPVAPLRSKIARERRESKIGIRGGATARGAMEKSRHVRIIEGKEVRGDDPI